MGQRWAGAAIPAALMIMTSHTAVAQTQAQRTYNIPEQDLAMALKAFAATSGREVVASSDVIAGKRSGAAVGPLSPEQAIEHILAGTGLSYKVVEGAFIVRPTMVAGAEGEPAPDQSEIVVTGSRIRGAPIASPVITIGREEITNAGQTSLGEVVRNIPQSFGGGHNPGVGTNVPASSGVDIGGGSSINLRGLGSDATLTLLNGHRLTYSASRQSVDISAIPLAAVDRIEIVADGASALYGSDAVAGVANIILRRGVNGVETGLSLGSSTDGGNFEQLYSLLGGTEWSSGEVMAAVEYGSNTAIRSEDRSYAATQSPGLTLYPRLRHYNGVFSAHQQIAAGISLDIDGLYNHRTNSTTFPLNPAGDLSVSGGRLYGTAESYGVTPTLRIDVAGDWRAFLSGSYGHDRVDFAADLFFGGVTSSGGAGFYRNGAKSLELGGDGSLFSAPGGLAKLALGAGYRTIDFAVFKGAANFQNVERSQDSYFGYAELSVPLISPDQESAFGERLNLSAAARYENYPGIGDIVTPKAGVIYVPTDDLSFKASWGRSFRAPTLLQQYNPSSVTLQPAARLGGAGLSPTATALLVSGGRADLKPEKATTWSATAAFHPHGVPGADIELSYFSTHYRDRIVTPIGATAIALSNPIYADLVSRDPSEAAQTAVIGGAGTFVNLAGAPYDPAKVVAIVDNSNVNAGRQTLQGVDLLLSYRTRFNDGRDVLTATLNGAYLESEQQLSPGQPVTQLAGTLFNPPHLRARGGLSWSSGPVTLAGWLNYSGRVEDRRFSPEADIDPVTTADFTLRISSAEKGGPLRGLDVRLSVLNAFNAKPSNIRTTLFTDTPYDSTNYSPVGRFVGIGITKSW